MRVNNSISIDEIKKIGTIPMLFILGKGRSGTTLLQSVLNSHPGIVGPPESKFMMVLYPRFAGIKHWSEKNIYDFIEELYRFPFFSKRWNIDRTRLTDYLLVAKEQLDYSLVCKIVYYLKGKNKENICYLSDKNPGYVLFIKKLFKLFPDAKFIHLVREPRDNVLSAFKAFGSHNSYYVATKWVALNVIIEKVKRKMPGRSMTIRYEDMVNNPEAVFSAICAFLNVSFRPEMINRKVPDNLNKDTNAMEMLKKMQEKLFSPISPSSIGKWKTDMKTYNAAVIERIAGRYAAQQYGYDMEKSQDETIHISPFKIIRAKCIYYTWQVFTRMRYSSYRLNKIYSRFKQKTGGEKLLPSEHF